MVAATTTPTLLYDTTNYNWYVQVDGNGTTAGDYACTMNVTQDSIDHATLIYFDTFNIKITDICAPITDLIPPTTVKSV